MRKSIKAISSFFKRVFTCPTAYIFLCAHWILFAIALYQRGGIYLSYHFPFEPLLIQILSIIDGIAYILGTFIFFVLFLPIGLVIEAILKLLAINIKTYDAAANVIFDSFYYLFIIFSISFEWMLIGYGIDKIITYKRDRIK